MKIIKSILLLLSLYMAGGALAQTVKAQKEQPSLNQTDSKGNRIGTWWIKMPEHMGEPAYSQIGNYDHGRKIGTWYKIDDLGDMMAVENYKNNVLDGEAKYYEQGKLTCIGHYRGLNPAYEYDTVMIKDPETDREFLKAIPTDKGTLRHGMWRYYDVMTGRLVREEEYQVDDLIYSKDFAAAPRDSTYYKQRTEMLMHPKASDKSSGAKRVSYLDY